MVNLSKLFGENLRKLRKSTKISQRNFSEKADLCERVIIKLEKGQVGIQFETLEKLCKALDIHPAALFADNSLVDDDIVAAKIKQSIQGLSKEKLELVYNLICDLKKI